MAKKEKPLTKEQLERRVKRLENMLSTAQTELKHYKDRYDPNLPKWKWNPRTVTYMDCYERIMDYINNRGYFANQTTDEDGDTEYLEVENENQPIDIMIYDGEYGEEEHECWPSVKAFVGGDENETSIFDRLARYDHNYYRLVSRWLVSFVDRCRPLNGVDVEKRTPAGIMKAMDKVCE